MIMHGIMSSILSNIKSITKSLIFLLFLFVSYVPAWAQQENPYTYVEMSLTVPWALYFMFLAFVLIPFGLFIFLAWREHLDGRK